MGHLKGVSSPDAKTVIMVDYYVYPPYLPPSSFDVHLKTIMLRFGDINVFTSSFFSETGTIGKGRCQSNPPSKKSYLIQGKQ
jgi:hypothetical protein